MIVDFVAYIFTFSRCFCWRYSYTLIIIGALQLFSCYNLLSPSCDLLNDILVEQAIWYWRNVKCLLGYLYIKLLWQVKCQLEMLWKIKFSLLYNLYVLILLLTYIEMLLLYMIVSKQFDIGELSNVCWGNFAKLFAKRLPCKVLWNILRPIRYYGKFYSMFWVLQVLWAL